MIQFNTWEVYKSQKKNSQSESSRGWEFKLKSSFWLLKTLSPTFPIMHLTTSGDVIILSRNEHTMVMTLPLI